MNIPDHLRYTSHHVWIELLADGTARAGITDYAQDTLGDIVFVEPPAVGSMVTEAQACGLIESVKTASDLYAPLTGKVVEINSELQAAPERINETPYAAWIFRMQLSLPAEVAQLQSAAEYRQLL